MKWQGVVGCLAILMLSAACSDGSTSAPSARAQGGAPAGGAGGTPASLVGGGASSAGSSPIVQGGAAGAGPGGTAGAGMIGPKPPYEVKVATWRGNAQGVYSIIHDDLCGSPISLEDGKASALLAMHGVKVAFGAIAGSCDEKWQAVKALQAEGHEIINHSWDHTDHVLARNLAVQVDQADAALKQNVGAEATQFYIFPFDSFDAESIGHVKALGYLGARGGKQGQINPANFSDDFALSYDVFGAGYSTYCDEGVCAAEQLTCCGVETPCVVGTTYTDQGSRSCRVSVVNSYVDAAIASGGWAMREFHGVDDGWEGIASDVYGEHLTYVASKVQARELWVATPTAVIKYRHARDACAPQLQGSRITFNAADPSCAKYATRLTLVVRSLTSTLTAKVAGQAVPAEHVGDEFLLDVEPSAGDVTLEP
jgi:hypothetical protein